MKADILNKGTQLKMLWYLQGNQKVIFKPKRYEREHVIKGKGNWLLDIYCYIVWLTNVR